MEPVTWEYCHYSFVHLAAQTESMFSKLGKLGWELVSVTPPVIAVGSDFKYKAFFKRRLG